MTSIITKSTTMFAQALSNATILPTGILNNPKIARFFYIKRQKCSHILPASVAASFRSIGGHDHFPSLPPSPQTLSQEPVAPFDDPSIKFCPGGPSM